MKTWKPEKHWLAFRNHVRAIHRHGMRQPTRSVGSNDDSRLPIAPLQHRIQQSHSPRPRNTLSQWVIRHTGPTRVTRASVRERMIAFTKFSNLPTRSSRNHLFAEGINVFARNIGVLGAGED